MNIRRTLLCFVILFSLLSAVVLASGGEGNGENSGEGLQLVSSSPSSGLKEIAINANINLTFNKNVVNMSVKDSNIKCFSLLDGNNKAVPIKVIMADDQVDPENKRNITIDPVQSLKPGTTYNLKISQELQAKNGTTLDKEIQVKFYTIINKSTSAPAQVQKSKTPEKQQEKAKAQTTTVVNNSTSDKASSAALSETQKEKVAEQAPKEAPVTQDVKNQSGTIVTKDSNKREIAQSTVNAISNTQNKGSKSLYYVIGIFAAGFGTFFVIRRIKR